jgi:hypothetical protein
LTVTAVAFAAETVRVEEDPEAMEAGLAAMLMVGAADGSVEMLPDFAPPQPVKANRRAGNNNAAKGETSL